MPRTHQHHVCRQCGKVETNHWARHWQRQHPDEAVEELIDGELPLAPHSEDWASFITGALKIKYFLSLQRASLLAQTAEEEEKRAGTLEQQPPAIDRAAHLGPCPIDSNPKLPAPAGEAVPMVLLQKAMRLTYTAKIKMTARLLDSVDADLAAESERICHWIYSRPFEDALPSVVTPRDRQQQECTARGRTLRVVQPKISEGERRRPRD